MVFHLVTRCDRTHNNATLVKRPAPETIKITSHKRHSVQINRLIVRLFKRRVHDNEKNLQNFELLAFVRVVHR